MSAAVKTIEDFKPSELFRAALSAGLKSAPPIDGRKLGAWLIAGLLAALVWLAPMQLGDTARLAMIVTLLCVMGWTATRIPDSIVAIAGAVALVVAGVLPAQKLYAALGNEIVWLLIAAFVIAAVLRSSGVAERSIGWALRPFRSVRGLFYGVTLVIAATAFLIPSTSGRAALLLPAFLALADRLPDQRLVRPLALLFPSVILLSAGGSLIGAGAHFIAVDAIAARTGINIGFVQWMLLALPVALASSLAATWLVLHLFVPAGARQAAITPASGPDAPLTVRQKSVLAVVAGMVLAWVTAPWHGLDVAMVAVIGAAALMSRHFTDLKPKELFRSVEMELILFLAATAFIAEAIAETGADTWLAGGILKLMPAAATSSLALVIAVTALVSLLAHVVINSRTARAAVLIPVLALPMAGLGHDPQLIMLVTVLGTGFCQTMMASAKPVAIYGNLDLPTFSQGDLLRLAVPLLPVKFALLFVVALFVWPHQLGQAQAVDAAPAAQPAVTAQAPIAGALCTRDELRRVMIATIAERRMWARGWWHVWNRLQKDGFPVEQAAVKHIYRADELVLMRRHSLEIAAVTADSATVEAARRACKGDAGNAAAPAL